MAIFQYSALDAQGVEIKDEVEALSQKEAISKIRNMGYFPTRVRARGAAKKAGARAVARPRKRRGAGGRVKVKYITQFARQLSTLQAAGLPILRSLRILEEQQRSGTFKRIIGYVGDDIEGGSTLSEAMGRYSRAFDRLLVSMVAAGETGVTDRTADETHQNAHHRADTPYPADLYQAQVQICGNFIKQHRQRHLRNRHYKGKCKRCQCKNQPPVRV